MAQAGRITKAAPAARIGRTPLTPKQREERSKRRTIQVTEQERRMTETVKSTGRAQNTILAGKIRRENIGAIRERTRETAQLRQREIAARTEAVAARQRNRISTARKERLTTELVEKPVVSGTQTARNSIGLVLGVFAVLIVFYAIITNPVGLTGWLGGLGNFIATLSQNGPLFTKTTSQG